MTFGKWRGEKKHPTPECLDSFAFDLKGSKLSGIIDDLIAFCFLCTEGWGNEEEETRM